MIKSDLKQKAYNLIKEKIIKCELLPEQDISEDALVNEMGISRTPIREALMRLEHERMVNIYPRKGMVVSSISVNVINDVFEVREIVEPQLAKRVIHYLSRDWLEDMRIKFSTVINSDETFWQNINLDKEFHSKLVSSGRNIYLIHLMDNIYDQVQRIRVLSYRLSERIETSNKEHLQIIDALFEKEIDKAEAAIRNHILNARSAALSLNRIQSNT